MNSLKNNYFIDNLKVVLIFLVVFGHLIERYIDSNNTLMGIYMFIYTFHMPLFIFISGLLSKNLNKSKKIFIKNLLVPYIILNIIWYSLSFLYAGKTNIPILYPGWTLWFLLSLFFWRISLKYLVEIKYILPISFVLGLLVGFVPNGSILSFSRTIVYLPYFLLGYFSNLETIKKYIDKVNLNIGGSIIGMFLFSILAFYIAENSIIDYKFLYGSYSYLELDMNIFKGLIYRSTLYIISILLSLLVCGIIPRKKTLYSSMAKSTMYVYAFHTYIVIAIYSLMPLWDKNMLSNWIILLSPILITYVLSRKTAEKAYVSMFSPILKLIKLT